MTDMKQRGDFTPAARDYALHRAGFPPSFFTRLAERGLGLAGQRVVDLGTGTGTVARGLAARGCVVTGVDLSAAMLHEAARMASDAGLSIDFRQASAEATGLPTSSADIVTAGQCWHWFDPDAASAEAARLLGPGGTLVLARFDWLPLAGNLAEATEQLILSLNPGWGMAGSMGLQPHWLRQLGERGWRAIESFSWDEEVRYTHDGWRGRTRACNGVGVDMPPSLVARCDDAMARMLRERFPGESLVVPHRVFVVTALRGGE